MLRTGLKTGVLLTFFVASFFFDEGVFSTKFICFLWLVFFFVFTSFFLRSFFYDVFFF